MGKKNKEKQRLVRSIKRAAKHKRKRAQAKKRRKAKELFMSRSQDIAYIETQIQKLQEEQMDINDTFQTYHQEVTEAIRELMVEANIYDEVRSLEEEREKTRQTAQKKVNDLGQQIQDLAKTRSFLLKREEEEIVQENSKKESDPHPEESNAPAESEPEKSDPQPEEGKSSEDEKEPEDMSEPPKKAKSRKKRPSPPKI